MKPISIIKATANQLCASLPNDTATKVPDIILRKYCYGKSIYQREEGGKKPRMVCGQPYPDRTLSIQRKNECTSKLSVFYENNPNPPLLNALQNLPNLDFQQVKNWWKSMKDLNEIENQKYMPERTATLGANLAALHFFTYRQAAVRLQDSDDWISGSLTTLAEELPHTYIEGCHIEAIDCSTFRRGIRYEGLQNLMGLNFLKWLSLKNQTHIDTWCLDRIAGQNGSSLEYLDISSCKLNLGCILALGRMPNLHKLIIKDPGEDIELQAALSYLEYKLPQCVINAAVNDNLKPVCADT